MNALFATHEITAFDDQLKLGLARTVTCHYCGKDIPASASPLSHDQDGTAANGGQDSRTLKNAAMTHDLQRSLIKYMAITVPPMFVLVLGISAKFNPLTAQIFPALNNPTLVNSMLAVDGVLAAYGLAKTVKYALSLGLARKAGSN